MEAAGYTLDLYCDDPLHAERHPTRYQSLDAQYLGETYGECKRQAKADGWKWVRSSDILDHNICGLCNRLNKKKKS